MAKKPIKRAIRAQINPNVGRGNPPKHSQFVKGKSGNPKGRPRGSKNVRTIITAAAKDQVLATIDGKPRRISKLQAAAMQLATKAAAGEKGAMGDLLDRIAEIEDRAAAGRPAVFPFGEADLEVLRTVYERMKQCVPESERD